IELPLRDAYPCQQCRDRTYVGEEVAHVQALCVMEQVERAVQVSFSFPDSSHRHAPSIWVLRQPDVLAQRLAGQQVLRGGVQIVPLTVELTHTHVHVCRSTEYRRARRRLAGQSLLVGAHGVAETTLRNPYIGQGHGATECVGVMPGPLQTRHSSGVTLVR